MEPCNFPLHLFPFYDQVVACDLELRDDLFGRCFLVSLSLLKDCKLNVREASVCVEV
jgi:hypothetical protein